MVPRVDSCCNKRVVRLSIYKDKFPIFHNSLLIHFYELLLTLLLLTLLLLTLLLLTLLLLIMLLLTMLLLTLRSVVSLVNGSALSVLRFRRDKVLQGQRTRRYIVDQVKTG